MANFLELVDLASERLGGSVLYANDEFFAEKENLLRAASPVWKEHEYTDRGKWMDGWESRRKRDPGHDFAIVRLGVPGIVRGVVVDTSFFRGNYPEACAFEACSMRPEASVEELLAPETRWVEISERLKLEGDSQNVFELQDPRVFTHIRFRIFPDGGVARLRVHGEVVPDWRRFGGLLGAVDLASIELGAEVLSCSDMFFGPKHNLIMPGRAANMSDGWETRRRRGPGHDWVLVRLATEGTIDRIEVDTNHFKGNHPDTISIEIRRGEDPTNAEWRELLVRTSLQPHTRHLFRDQIQRAGPATHLRLNVFPDGGVSRLRVWGMATEKGRERAVVRRLDTLTDECLEAAWLACCASKRFVERITALRPYGTWQRLLDVSTETWWSLGSDDWHEAFRAHPRIGERSTGSGTFARWSDEEQSRLADGDPVRTALLNANREYEERFGFLFIVCATGKSSSEMLEMLRARMLNGAEDELCVAAEEQRKITMIRLGKLVL